ncbi:hypothetical protein SAMN04487996_1198 [Dyadobacter soli]|uniref:Uncharacterized protein n=1 Tax=Dyadobacter soli TaxID=659014 RepID=A0A1G7UHU9_9BACT|nr:hypothetical protein SAMN04487996_1198 [Dyadobacter soli]
MRNAKRYQYYIANAIGAVPATEGNLFVARYGKFMKKTPEESPERKRRCSVALLIYVNQCR